MGQELTVFNKNQLSRPSERSLERSVDRMRYRQELSKAALDELAEAVEYANFKATNATTTAELLSLAAQKRGMSEVERNAFEERQQVLLAAIGQVVQRTSGEILYELYLAPSVDNRNFWEKLFSSEEEVMRNQLNSRRR